MTRPFSHPYDGEQPGLRDYLPSTPDRRRRLHWGWVLALGFLLGLLAGVPARAADGPPCVTLQVRPTVMLVRGDIRAEMRVARHADHRWLVLSWDGGAAGAGSSREQLEGADAEVVHTRWLRSQLPGAYVFVATIFDGRGKPVGRDTAAIQTPGGTP